MDWRNMSVIIPGGGIPGLSKADHIYLHYVTADLYVVSNTTDDDERKAVLLRKPQKGLIDKSGRIIIPVEYGVLEYCEFERKSQADGLAFL